MWNFWIDWGGVDLNSTLLAQWSKLKNGAVSGTCTMSNLKGFSITKGVLDWFNL